ncbi:MAG TPA: response regulator [Magnetospirillum sp.]|nr:response regulator [Magnetospirillum sp.]
MMRPSVLVAVGSETLALRLRLMVEAEGGEPVTLRDGASPIAAITVPALTAQVRQHLPDVRVIELADGDDWEGVRGRLATLLAPPAACGPSESDQLSAALSASHLLVVDDSVTYREFLRMELEKLGATITVCGKPEDVLDQLAAGAYDGVLIDLVMPGVDGAELCGRAARMRRDSGKSYVLAVLSSRENKPDLIRSLEAGADLFLGKSQDTVILRAKLGAMLRMRALRR